MMDEAKAAAHFAGCLAHVMTGPPRDVPRLAVHVNIAPQSGASVVGVWWPPRLSTQVIYEDELPRLEARTQTEAHREAWTRAVAAHDAHVAEWVEKMTPEDQAAAHRYYWNDAPRALERWARARIPSAPAVHFCKEFKTGMPPVISYLVLARLPPPSRTESRSEFMR